uniref:ADP-ribosylation factor-like 15a n=1 Tax=Fundulus heteroclitus TaxID=8078 RepID=A0A3Q2NZT8_FUNHE
TRKQPVYDPLAVAVGGEGGECTETPAETPQHFGLTQAEKKRDYYEPGSWCWDWSAIVHGLSGFSIKAVPFPNAILNVKELGGADNIKKYWSRYYQGSQGVIFVLDSASSDEDLEAARNELHSALQHPQLCTLPFLILANHQDKPAARAPNQNFSVLFVEAEIVGVNHATRPPSSSVLVCPCQACPPLCFPPAVPFLRASSPEPKQQHHLFCQGWECTQPSFTASLPALVDAKPEGPNVSSPPPPHFFLFFFEGGAFN